jgi:hypothetical protein
VDSRHRVEVRPRSYALSLSAQEYESGTSNVCIWLFSWP